LSRLLFGPAGFQYSDWKGVFYPAGVNKKYGHELGFLARYFDLCEINTSFYGPLRPEHAVQWCEHVSRVNPDFQFTAKLTRVFTHAQNAQATSSSSATVHYTQKDVDEAKAGFDPLRRADRLGGIVIQFPISFKYADASENAEPEPLYGNCDHLFDILNLFREYPLAVEFRDAGWNNSWIIRELTERRVAFCNLDQPHLGNSLDETQHVTAPFAYIRLHGRNYGKWFTAKSRDERYDFLYNGEQLERVRERVSEMSRKAEKIFVVSNNHPRGQAAVNALELRSLFSGEKVRAPGSLVEAYPQLRERTFIID
jgi:uncharacterized protein YecE (DUF72 family)